MGPASCGPYLSLGSEGSAGRDLSCRTGVAGSAASASTRRRGSVGPALSVPRRTARGRSPCWIARREITVPSAHSVPSAVSRSGASRPRGHGKSELGAAAGGAAHADRAAVRLDQALDDVQAQAGAAAVPAPAAAVAGLAAPELAEHPGSDVRRDALTLVTD